MSVGDLKPYRFEFDDKAEYLSRSRFGKQRQLEISRQYRREIADECRRIKCSKLLIVEDIKEIVSPPEMYQIASEIPRLGFHGVRMTFVDRYIEQQTLNEFGEIVATNRGIHGKIFNSVEEAEKRLLSK